ncbi:MAG: helix-turn-helix domain-containing protein [Actinomycetota bacterium]|nr:helix-turn-helix domain-containing protein [Actinomycetota bacterium]
MNELAERRKTHGALAVASRVRLLDALRASSRPLDARELAAACGLHVSTVRFHLEVLSEAGLVRSQSEPARGRGRPRLLHTPASAGDASGPEGTSYQWLATVLAAYWADTPAERTQRAERAGHALATAQRLAPPPSTGPTVEESVTQVSGLFAELGFEPELAREGQDLQIRLHACPFRAVAAQHPEVVCSLHLGLLRGALVELGAPATVSSLAPFVEPHLCIARVTPVTESAPDEPSADAQARS